MKDILSIMAPVTLVIFVVSTMALLMPAHAASSSSLSHHFHGSLPSGVMKSSVEGGGSNLMLAAERTRRKDPLDGFKYYNGGWNITNKHYITSVAFTAAPLFFAAAIWLGVFGLCLLLSCLCYCCCGHREYGYSRIAYACSVIFLLIFTVAAIIGAGFLYTGQGKFHTSTTDTLDYVVEQAESTVYNLRNVSAYLSAAKQIKVNQLALPQDVQANIDKVDGEIGSAATTLETETKTNRDRILDVLKIVRLVLIVVSAMMLFVALLGFLFSICGLLGLVYILVVVGWILVAGTLILSSVFVALHNATGDTCVAMDEWAKNPEAHTALDDILPCVDTATAQESLSQSKVVVFQLIGVVNSIINNVTNVNFPRVFPPVSYNQSGPLVPVLCNPLHPDGTDRKCAAGEVGLLNATQVWRNYMCQVSRGVCMTVGRLTPDLYNQMESVVNVSYGLYHYGPFLTDLVDCDFVRDTFIEIHKDHCPELRQYSSWVSTGLVLVAAAVALSLILWVLYARERRHRKYTKLVDAVARHDPYGGKTPY